MINRALSKSVKRTFSKINFGVTEASTQVQIIDNLEEFGTQYGITAQNDLKEKKQLVLYQNDSRVLFLNSVSEKPEDVRGAQLGDKAIKFARGLKIDNLVVQFPSSFTNDSISQFVYGAQLSNYSFGEKTKEDTQPHFVNSISLQDSTNQEIDSSVYDFHFTMANAKNFARNLANGRVNTVNIDYFIKQAEEFTSTHSGVELEVLKDQELWDNDMRLHYSVGMASVNRPALINMTYRGNPESEEIHSMVGKGIVFDTGGLNLKPTGYMEDMYVDKGGASAVFGAFKGVVEAGLKINLTVSIPLAENSVSDNSYRPSDVIVSKKGLTVEITNTDAEGRLILADAMTYTQQKYNPVSMIELSTLTGACMVALGNHYAGLFTNCSELGESLTSNGAIVGERMWELPIYDEVREDMKGKASDLVNSGAGRYAGAIQAAAFLEHFVEEGVNWAHVDIAGPSKLNKPHHYYETGATGYGVGFLMQHYYNIQA